MSETDHQAREFHGLIRLLEDLGGATESLFSRFYGSLTERNKIKVDAEKYKQYRERSEALRQRSHYQAMEISRLTGILGVIDEGVVMQNNEGRIILMNEAARRLIGSAKNFWASDLGLLFQRAQEIVPSERQMQIVGRPERVMVNDRIVGVKLAAVNNLKGEILGSVMLLRDVTDDSISERLKDSFIGQLSHELRTPLTAIKGMSDVLLNLPEGKPPKRSFLEAISRNVALLDRMVVELLDISEISADAFEIERDPLALDELTFTVLKGFEDNIEKANLHATSMIANHRALQLGGDNRRLQWALGHLIENAIHYTQPGGDIVIQMGKIRDRSVLLEVEDSGVGIQPNDMPRIFERFYRGEARSPDGKVIDPRGLGQGLFIARRVIEAHGGNITATSTPGQGSTFTVELPLAS